MTFRSSLFLLAILALGACRLGKNYQRPDLALPDHFAHQTAFGDTSSVAAIPWNTFFTDTTLNNLIAGGLAHNNDLLAALSRVESARQQVVQSKFLWYPQLDLQVSGQTNHFSKNSLTGLGTGSITGYNHFEDYVAGANVSWDLNVWGKISRQQEAARAAYLQQFEAARAVQTGLVADIAEGYFNLLMLDRQLEIARRNLALNDSTLQVTSLLREAGEATTLAVQQAASQKLSTALLIPQFEQGIALQENALRLLCGSYPDSIARVASLDGVVISDSLSAGVPAAVVSRRPDVRSAELNLVAANARVGVAQANLYPTLNITAGAGFESFKRSNWFATPGSVFGIVTGTIAEPLFHRRQLKTAYEVAKQDREQAVFQFRQSVLVAAGEVSNALVSIGKLREQFDLAGAQVDTLQRAVGNANLLFRSDYANYLEVILAQRDALQAELNLVAIRRQLLNAKVDLYRALGGGF